MNSLPLPHNAIRQLPKADLHVHLNGCVPTEVMLDLLQQHGAIAPGALELNDLRIVSPAAGLVEYLRPWKYFKRLPIGQQCLKRMALGALSSLAEDNVRYAELRNSPFNIASLNNISLAQAVEWIQDAVLEASAATGVDGRLVLSLTRHEIEDHHSGELLGAIRSASRADTIVGVDISGNEDAPHSVDLACFFRSARDELGLGVSIHAGETGNPDNIRWAVEECGAMRIGHGLALGKDRRLYQLLRERGVCVEVCLISNMRTGQVREYGEHVVGDFIREGVPFVLCSDNPAVHAAPLSTDYSVFAECFGYEQIDGMFKQQMKYAFARSA